MEIDPNEKILAPVAPERPMNTKRNAQGTFEAIFDEFIGNSKNIDEGGHNTPALNDISAIKWNPFVSPGEMSVVERAEKMLETLDEYQRKLASSRYTLKDISPLIREMEDGNEILASAVDSLSDGDELKNILNQIIITSSVEIIKFNRGDYVNP